MRVAKTYFVDTSFWISLMVASDDHHVRALQWQQKVVAEHNALLTTEAVLCEDAVRLYAARPDKEWGMVDCFSFELMRSRGVRAASSPARCPRRRNG